MAAVTDGLVQYGVYVSKNLLALARGEKDRGGALLRLVAVTNLAGRLRKGELAQSLLASRRYDRLSTLVHQENIQDLGLLVDGIYYVTDLVQVSGKHGVLQASFNDIAQVMCAGFFEVSYELAAVNQVLKAIKSTHGDRKDDDETEDYLEPEAMEKAGRPHSLRLQAGRLAFQKSHENKGRKAAEPEPVATLIPSPPDTGRSPIYTLAVLLNNTNTLKKGAFRQERFESKNIMVRKQEFRNRKRTAKLTQFTAPL
jgi:hypothetical protein